MSRNEKVVGKGILDALKKRLSCMESKESCPMPFHFFKETKDYRVQMKTKT